MSNESLFQREVNLFLNTADRTYTNIGDVRSSLNNPIWNLIEPITAKHHANYFTLSLKSIQIANTWYQVNTVGDFTYFWGADPLNLEFSATIPPGNYGIIQLLELIRVQITSSGSALCRPIFFFDSTTCTVSICHVSGAIDFYVDFGTELAFMIGAKKNTTQAVTLEPVKLGYLVNLNPCRTIFVSSSLCQARDSRGNANTEQTNEYVDDAPLARNRLLTSFPIDLPFGFYFAKNFTDPPEIKLYDTSFSSVNLTLTSEVSLQVQQDWTAHIILREYTPLLRRITNVPRPTPQPTPQLPTPEIPIPQNVLKDAARKLKRRRTDRVII
jgi:hypothetical protein